MWQCGCGMGGWVDGWVDRWVGIRRSGGVSAIGHGLHTEHYTQGSWLVHNVCVSHTLTNLRLSQRCGAVVTERRKWQCKLLFPVTLLKNIHQ